VWDYDYVHYQLPFTERNKFVKGLGCPTCSENSPIEVTEEDKAIANIIESINDITGQCQTLERKMRNAKKGGILPSDQAYHALDSFFYSCQVAEDRIKIALEKGYIHEIHRNHLNEELGSAVERMIGLARRSILYHNVMRDLAASKPSVAEIMQPHISPADRSPQVMLRKRPRLDSPSL
jgi:Zn ribbon nucleic-acid-binding protein